MRPKIKIALLMVAALFFLTACTAEVDKAVTLADHEGKEITFPREKPVLFFFITTYT